MSFDDDETGPESSQPREIYDVTHGTTTYRIASGQRDVFYAGNRYIATPGARAELVIQALTEDAALELSLPASHALAQRYVALSSPPNRIDVVVRRVQLTSGEALQIWVGSVTSMAFDRHVAKFRAPSRSRVTFQRRLPTIVTGSTCQHILYDGGCRIVRGAFTVNATVAGLDGRIVTVSTMGGNPDHWAQFGALLHVPSGEQMTIVDQLGDVITMQAPIVELAYGDAVQVSAGCDHSIETCKLKFSNVVNFGGQPDRPTGNAFVATGLGVIIQS